MAPVDTRYYDALGVSPTCQESELRSAYKKKALRLHPDKGGDPQEFQRMKEAYDVLIDPQRRKTYDAYGVEGLKMMEGNGAASPEVMLAMLSRSGKACIMAVLLGLALTVLSPVILLALRWDETVSWHWTISFIPLWIFHLIVFAFLALIRPPPAPTDQDDLDPFSRAMYAERRREVRINILSGVVTNSLLVLQEVFLALRLQDTVDWPWLAVAVPAFLLELFLMIKCACLARKAWTRQVLEAAAGEAARPPRFLCCFFLQNIWWDILRLITVFLIAARADKVFEGTWYLCLIALFIGGATSILNACGKKIAAAAQCRGDVENDPAGFSQRYGRTDEGIGVCGACCFVGSWLFIACFGASKLDEEAYSAFIVFLPLFVVVLCLTCFTSVFLLLLGGPPQRRQATQPPQHKPEERPQGSAPDSGTPQRADTSPAAEVVGSPAAAAAGGHSTAAAALASSSDSNGVELKAGFAVVIHGLMGSPELNDKQGTCESWDAHRERWSVRLPLGDVKAIRPCNLLKIG